MGTNARAFSVSDAKKIMVVKERRDIDKLLLGFENDCNKDIPQNQSNRIQIMMDSKECDRTMIL